MRSSAGSVSQQLHRLKEGESDAIVRLWDRYFQQLIRLARSRLRADPRFVGYDEDVAISAFASFFRAVERDRFPDLRDRNDLWQILVMLSHRKAYKMKKRNSTNPIGGSTAAEFLLSVMSRDPTPDDAAAFAEECEHRLQQLGDDKLRQVALLKLEGLTNDEVAERLDCVPRTIERKLSVIRDIWTIKKTK